MKLPLHLPLRELLTQISTPRLVHIRLALTCGDDNQWLARSLVVDVFPQRCLDNPDGFFVSYRPPRRGDEYDRARFVSGFAQTQEVVSWFAHPDDCRLAEFDSAPGQGSKVQRFHLPALQEYANGTRITSRTWDGFATLPWPHYAYRCEMQGPHMNVKEDYESLYAPGQRHFDNFREARAALIHGMEGPLRSYQDQDEVEIRVVDTDGWIDRVLVDESETRFDVNVGGFGLDQGHVILKGNDQYDDKPVEVPEVVTFELKSAPLEPLTFILANKPGELDRARYVRSASPMTGQSSPHIVKETKAEEEPVGITIGPSVMETHLTAPSAMRPNAKAALDRLLNPEGEPTRKGRLDRFLNPDPPTPKVQVLKVVIASPGDVPKERACVPKVLEELNKGVAGELGLRLEPWQWETDAYPGFHVDGPQGQVDQGMQIEGAEIVIGIFWKKFGTPVADAKSGTEHELLRARDAWQKTGHPHIMVYFNQQPFMPKSTAENEQFHAVLDFKDRLAKDGLWWTYRGSRQFEDLVRRHLTQFLRERYRGKQE
jgi:hypothetical protein